MQIRQMFFIKKSHHRTLLLNKFKKASKISLQKEYLTHYILYNKITLIH
ncbi:MAG: hypothetical protein KatS3mg033_1485 [Thermonema sp.]|nr:MAG: hypothetical protein KatS3mg033_1485 [Thermonema sp.]